MKKMKASVVFAMSQLERIRRKAAGCGIDIKTSVVDCSGQTQTIHWMFDKGERRLLDYWPGNGRWFEWGQKSKGFVQSPDEALAKAIELTRPARQKKKKKRKAEKHRGRRASESDRRADAHLRSIGRQSL